MSDFSAKLQMFEATVRTQGVEAAFRLMSSIFGEAVALEVRKEYEKKIGLISALPGSPTIVRTGFRDWYSGPNEGDRFWPALKRYLIEKKGWPTPTVDALDHESTNVMRRLQPSSGPVDVKGLVVGYVQSGKTANYSALIAKAADVGYRLVIVLAGIHNSLRRQTQSRLEAELIHADPEVKKMWHTLTTPLEDFRAQSTNTDAFLSDLNHQRILLVVKKNAQVLKRLTKWLERAQPRLLEACPALIIDDEADQAGLNSGKDDDEHRTKINKLILGLKKSLPKSAYVGYTATPFANVLVDPSGRDLYPSDFIVALGRPTNYFGAELFFGREPLEDEGADLPEPPDMFRVVPTEEVSQLRPSSRASAGSFTAAVPPSLRTALEYFLLATAARWARGHRMKHSSMLVHTSLNLSLHAQMSKAIKAELKRIQAASKTEKGLDALRTLWSDESARVRSPDLEPVSFDEVRHHLPEVFARLRVVVDNGVSEDRLLYKEEHELAESDDVVHVAVGGNTLSRGLTLEGLVVSYFVRTANAYDTLLQMGRWFGYRFGYADLPRIWMTEELRSAFRALATVEQEIRNDIARYAEERLTPLQFAVRIRTHPGLAVTSRLKMRHAVTVQLDYTGSTRQTTIFRPLDGAWLNANWEAGAKLVRRLTEDGFVFQERTSHLYAAGVPAARITEFLRSYVCHPDHTELDARSITAYVEKQNAAGRFPLWTVAVATLSRPDSRAADLGPLRVRPVTRSVLERGTDGASVDLGTITTQRNFTFDVETADGAMRSQSVRPTGAEPLLLLVPINKDSQPLKPVGVDEAAQKRRRERGQLAAVSDILGMALAFPTVPGTSPVEYVQVGLPEAQEDQEDFVLPEEDDG